MYAARSAQRLFLLALLEARLARLVETLCESLAAACLRDKRVAAARVRVEKPDTTNTAISAVHTSIITPARIHTRPVCFSTNGLPCMRVQ